jgi:hypothetical protein
VDNEIPFTAKSPLAKARDLAVLDIKKDISGTELQWLYANPILWLKALQQLKMSAQNGIAKDKLSLAPLKPKPGTHPNKEYLDAKNELDQRMQGRLHFIGLVDTRLNDVLSILGPRPAYEKISLGTVIGVFSVINTLIEEDDVEGAMDLIDHMIKKWSDALRKLE